MSWLDEVTKQHLELESPASFWIWSGLSAISAILKDNVWINRADAYNLYPNIYVILHADSGLKKGPPISMAKELVKIVDNTKIISGRSSIQGIMRKLASAHTVPGGKVIGGATGFICSSELSSSLVDDPAALTILTDLYDRNYNFGEWESLLKMDQFNLRDPTVSLLGGINEAHAESFLGKKDIQGGFIARTFVVYEKEEQTINSLMQKLTNPPNRPKLAEYLKELAKLKGKFADTFDEKNNLTTVGRYYDEWYNAFRRQVKEMEVKDETGTLNRFGDSVLKVAMLLSLAREPKLEIDLQSMEEAIIHCEKLVGNVRKVTIGKKGLSQSSNLKGMVINELLNRDNHQVSRTVLMKKMWMHYSDSNEFDEIMLSFDSSGMIKTNSVGNQILYTMPDGEVKEMKRFLEGKNK